MGISRAESGGYEQGSLQEASHTAPQTVNRGKGRYGKGLGSNPEMGKVGILGF